MKYLLKKMKFRIASHTLTTIRPSLSLNLNLNLSLSLLLLILSVSGCKGPEDSDLTGLQIAFLADVHFHDVYYDFPDTDDTICINPVNGKNTIAFSMQRQLRAIRRYNENYFAFLAALDDLVSRDVKLVVLPGDFLDDGQVMNVKGMKRILDEYSEKYQMQFFLITGNHDPLRPYATEGVYNEIIGTGGKVQPVISREGLYTSSPDRHEWPEVVTEDIRNAGYREIITIMNDKGFFPDDSYLYWETPFSTYTRNDYSFEKAMEQASLENRMYEVHSGVSSLPDVSYLAEPIKGLWLLAIDANVYVPAEGTGNGPTDVGYFEGAGRAGFNELIVHKRFILDWVQTVAERAKEKGKLLIAFSHYPLVEYTHGTYPELEQFLEPFQLITLPREDVSAAFADAGISVHFAGHVHNNQTGVKKTDKGNTLFNIQVPSLGTYIPAYKLVTVRDRHLLEIETIVIDQVPRYNEFFELYRMEYSFLEQHHPSRLWNKRILSSGNYRELLFWHFKDLVLHRRHFPQHWPNLLQKALPGMTGQDLLILSQYAGEIPDINLYGASTGILNIHPASWQTAKEKARLMLEEEGLTFDGFAEWSGLDLVFDFYRLFYAGELAFDDIGEKRIQQYRLLARLFAGDPVSDDGSEEDLKRRYLSLLFSIMKGFLDGNPSVHFVLDLKKGEILNVNQ